MVWSSFGALDISVGFSLDVWCLEAEKSMLLDNLPSRLETLQGDSTAGVSVNIMMPIMSNHIFKFELVLIITDHPEKLLSSCKVYLFASKPVTYTYRQLFPKYSGMFHFQSAIFFSLP
eukprot:TRINITY_DN42110_c0_g1_i1.p1 TRINITY_DN42110_c0_g1~~TRINITY_DN42110_c0_g1_i1.p1  ORF type:complete len:118 (+),score=15.97 TRINITY_DN42110_c0_g1_i1:215-568(+)